MGKNRDRDWLWQSAHWMQRFAGGTLGPGGGAKLVDGDWVESGAEALRNLGTVGPVLEPYRRLGMDVARFTGDLATSAVYLAASLVRGAQDLSPPSALDGYETAERQALAVLAAHREGDANGTSLEAIAPREWIDVLLPHMKGGLDLDAVDIQVGEGARFGAGLIWPSDVGHPWNETAHLEGKIVLIDGPPRTMDAKSSVQTTQQLQAFAAHEVASRQHWISELKRQDVVAVVSHRDLGHYGEAAENQLLVWKQATRHQMTRLEELTGAVCGNGTNDAVLGTCRLSRRQGQWWLEGPGPAWTFEVPGKGVTADAQTVRAERLLRAAGAWAESPYRITNDWAALVAQSLADGAPAVPGRASLAWTQAAEALRGLSRTVRRNAGQDTFSRGQADGFVLASAVEMAIKGAFGVARQLLAMDSILQKRPSHMLSLRGSNARPGSPKGMPGDVPHDM